MMFYGFLFLWVRWFLLWVCLCCWGVLWWWFLWCVWGVLGGVWVVGFWMGVLNGEGFFLGYRGVLNELVLFLFCEFSLFVEVVFVLFGVCVFFCGFVG
jgi:hypothetical protein